MMRDVIGGRLKVIGSSIVMVVVGLRFGKILIVVFRKMLIR